MYVLSVQYRLLLRPEKEKILVGKKSSSHLSGRFAIVITTGKKSSSRLSGGCAIAVTTGIKKVLIFFGSGGKVLLRSEKKVLVVCLAGCAVVSVFGSGGK